MTREERLARAAAVRRWLELERERQEDDRCDLALREAIGDWAPFSPLPGFADGVLAALAMPGRAVSLGGHWFWRAAVALVAVQTALLAGLFNATAESLIERLGPSGVVAGLARGVLSSGRSLAELSSFGRSLADASRVVGSAATTPAVLLVLAGCLAASAAGAWLVSSQLARDDREMIGASS
ncbi:MAG TPA: hypothetical protein VMT85_01595 [Thermoanaerobaculia bacterium]|nr:hypothetical protein [Thermoanaerobaculia bacterium]